VLRRLAARGQRGAFGATRRLVLACTSVLTSSMSSLLAPFPLLIAERHLSTGVVASPRAEVRFFSDIVDELTTFSGILSRPLWWMNLGST